MNTQTRIALFFSSFRPGGVERVQINLAGEFLRRGHQVDLVVVRVEGKLISQAPEGARIVNLDAARTLAAIPALARYLRENRPDALLSAQTHNNCAAVAARRLAKCACRLTLSEHNDMQMVLKSPSIKEKMRPFMARFFYRHADGIVAVSQGTAEALSAAAGLPIGKIRTIYNPVVTPELLRMAKEKPGHPWLEKKKNPVIISVGRLEPQKNYSALLAAFALARKEIESNLLILGEGSERKKLEARANDLGISSFINMPGFQPNPFSYLSHADVFTLSSQWEGLSNVIIEALACGTPVVSTNCPSGPAEILMDGKYGTLVPVGDAQAMARAILDTIDHPPDSALLRSRAEDFSVEKIADQYLEVLL